MILKSESKCLEYAISKLPKRSRRILRMRFWDGFTNKEISDVELISGSRVSAIVQRSYDRLLLILRFYGFNPLAFWAEHRTQTAYVSSPSRLSVGYEMDVPPYIQSPSLIVEASQFRSIPRKPGCYAWIDTALNQVMRVGLSVNLRNRVCSYLSERDKASVELCKWYWSQDPDQHVAVAVWECSELRALERMLLDEFAPPLNVIGGTLARKVS